MALQSGGSRKKSSPAILEARQRQQQALDLRLAGATLEAIAGKLGYKDAASVYNAIKAILERTVAAPAAELREIEVRRLDAMLLALWPKARAGDLGSIDRALKISERRARLLGLDAPTQLTGPNGGPIALTVTVFDVLRSAAAPDAAPIALPEAVYP